MAAGGNDRETPGETTYSRNDKPTIHYEYGMEIEKNPSRQPQFQIPCICYYFANHQRGLERSSPTEILEALISSQ